MFAVRLLVAAVSLVSCGAAIAEGPFAEFVAAGVAAKLGKLEVTGPMAGFRAGNLWSYDEVEVGFTVSAMATTVGGVSRNGGTGDVYGVGFFQGAIAVPIAPGATLNFGAGVGASVVSFYDATISLDETALHFGPVASAGVQLHGPLHVSASTSVFNLCHDYLRAYAPAPVNACFSGATLELGVGGDF